MDEFNDRLSRLSELSPDEIATLIDEMVTAFDAADTAGDLDTMQKLADALEQARNAQSQGAGNAAEPVTASGQTEDADTQSETTNESTTVTVAAEEDAASEDATSSEEPPAEDAPEPQNTTAEADTTEAATDAEESAATTSIEDSSPVEETVAEDSAPETTDAITSTEEPQADASADAEAEPQQSAPEEDTVNLTADDVPESNEPLAAAAPAVTIRAGGDIPGITAGTELTDLDEVIDAMTRKVNAMRGINGDGQHVVVASMRHDENIGEEKILRPGDADGNSRKIRELLSDRSQLTPESLVAAGWCAPRAPIYEVPTAGVTDRPVRDFLPSFAADRGGITWMQPPALPDLSDAVGLWRYSTDDSAWGSFDNPAGDGTAGETKPCLTVACGDERSVDLEPITQCLCFDNLTARAFPEWIRGNTDLTMVAQSRFAEQVLLSKMFAEAGAATCGDPTTALGAARDFLVMAKLAGASLRWRHRLGATAPLQILAPAWVRDAIALDLSLQAPGDDKLSVGYAEVEGYLRDAQIDPIWYIDDAPGTDAFDICTGFPTSAHWLIFPTGSYLRIDGGSLDLGVVRTKEDVQKNTYCQFAETFESVAYMGPASPNGWVLHGETPIQIEGGTACCDNTGS